MSNAQWYEMRTLLSGATLPVLELAVFEQDSATAVNLTGYAVTVKFWVTGAAPHVIRSGYVEDAAAGLTRYELDGSEMIEATELLYQFTLMKPGSVNDSKHEWASMASPVFRRQVIAAAA